MLNESGKKATDTDKRQQNLQPVRTKKEARERGKNGGVKSGEARREKKLLKDSLLAILDTDEGQEKICTALFQQARRGNIKAFEVLRDTIGQKPVDQVEQSVKAEITITGAVKDWAK
jgi:hypothetical protein